jgi:hypothetical protein
MNNTYVIQWKSKMNGRAGRGTKTFSKEEGERLVAELNREYPQIFHELTEVQTLDQEQPVEQPASGLIPLLSIA